MDKQTIKLQRGTMLLSAPFLNDIFKRSVILLTEHNEEGSVGFIVNKLSEYKLNQVVDDFPDFAAPVYVGGPVQQNMLNFIHRSRDLSGGTEIGNGIYWGGDFENLRFLIDTGQANPDEFRFLLGYSGWGPSQLETELERDSWYLSNASAEFVFKDQSANLWSDALKKLGNKYAFISTFPDDPSRN